MSLLKSKKKRDKKEQEELNKDIQACLNEINPIIQKYNLVLRARVKLYDDGILAVPVLGRQPEQPQAQPQAPAQK